MQYIQTRMIPAAATPMLYSVLAWIISAPEDRYAAIRAMDPHYAYTPLSGIFSDPEIQWHELCDSDKRYFTTQHLLWMLEYILPEDRIEDAEAILVRQCPPPPALYTINEPLPYEDYHVLESWT